MKFVYPNTEATQWADSIFIELAIRGHFSAVVSALTRLQDIENELEAHMTKFNDLYRAGQYEKLLLEMLATVKGDEQTEETFSILLKMLKDGGADIVPKIQDLLRLGMKRLGSDGSYQFEYAIDLMVALDALFHQAVAGPVFADEANRIMVEIFDCKIHLEPSEGDGDYPVSAPE